ncbi:conserved Plasmodium protein, unknown function [Plasmodium malariae]|uniref:Uncharacterized protein n=1 Tax=Plasmodium malariae TaxID=5858 RepID=A0A1C3L2P0_PLAMA|nr:conserved Plasmodium protein, unknown function [Plasmodium malariae]
MEEEENYSKQPRDITNLKRLSNTKDHKHNQDKCLDNSSTDYGMKSYNESMDNGYSQNLNVSTSFHEKEEDYVEEEKIDRQLTFKNYNKLNYSNVENAVDVDEAEGVDNVSNISSVVDSGHVGNNINKYKVDNSRDNFTYINSKDKILFVNVSRDSKNNIMSLTASQKYNIQNSSFSNNLKKEKELKNSKMLENEKHRDNQDVMEDINYNSEKSYIKVNNNKTDDINNASKNINRKDEMFYDKGHSIKKHTKPSTSDHLFISDNEQEININNFHLTSNNQSEQSNVEREKGANNNSSENDDIEYLNKTKKDTGVNYKRQNNHNNNSKDIDEHISSNDRYYIEKNEKDEVEQKLNSIDFSDNYDNKEEFINDDQLTNTKNELHQRNKNANSNELNSSFIMDEMSSEKNLNIHNNKKNNILEKSEKLNENDSHINYNRSLEQSVKSRVTHNNSNRTFVDTSIVSVKSKDSYTTSESNSVESSNRLAGSSGNLAGSGDILGGLRASMKVNHSYILSRSNLSETLVNDGQTTNSMLTRQSAKIESAYSTNKSNSRHMESRRSYTECRGISKNSIKEHTEIAKNNLTDYENKMKVSRNRTVDLTAKLINPIFEQNKPTSRSITESSNNVNIRSNSVISKSGREKWTNNSEELSNNQTNANRDMEYRNGLTNPSMEKSKSHYEKESYNLSESNIVGEENNFREANNLNDSNYAMHASMDTITETHNTSISLNQSQNEEGYISNESSNKLSKSEYYVNKLRNRNNIHSETVNSESRRSISNSIYSHIESHENMLNSNKCLVRQKQSYRELNNIRNESSDRLMNSKDSQIESENHLRQMNGSTLQNSKYEEKLMGLRINFVESTNNSNNKESKSYLNKSEDYIEDSNNNLIKYNLKCSNDDCDKDQLFNEFEKKKKHINEMNYYYGNNRRYHLNISRIFLKRIYN